MTHLESFAGKLDNFVGVVSKHEKSFMVEKQRKQKASE